jgi:hypothetical protein
MSTNAQLSEWEKSRTGVTEEQETRGEREREREREVAVVCQKF